MAEQDVNTQTDQAVDQAVAQGGAYDIIRKRLLEQGKQLAEQTQALNDARLLEFGSSAMEVAARVRVRTENNCIARDIVQVGDCLLFGYNVYIGLKKETKVDDVFALFKVKPTDTGFDLDEVPTAGSFLAQTAFTNDFEELYRYYKHTKLVQLRVNNGKLLAGFQIGERLDDIRVFRWSISADGKTIEYIDNRGERDIQLPNPYDFEWIETTRDQIVHGRHAHMNVADTLFIETTGGDLTVKIENNTQDGQGIYSEPVVDKTQSLDDAQIAYALVGNLVLVKILPYREDDWRYLVFNKLTETILRIDAIGASCVQLPEDHGLIFPGGYYLESGEFKSFDEPTAGLTFKRAIRSPNGEDMLYVFYEPEAGLVGLFAYNLIEKQLQNPIFGHGYALAEDGLLVIFTAESEPTRVHPMQIWRTPYQSAEFASKAPASQTELGKIGNAELVRGVSDLYSIARMINNQSVSQRLYEELGRAANKIFDDHYWLGEGTTADLAPLLKEINNTAELVIDEFEKVQSIRKQSAKAMIDAEAKHDSLVTLVRTQSWETAEEFVGALSDLRRQRGHLTTIKEYRYIDTDRINELDEELQTVEAELSQATVAFLANDEALEPYYGKIDALVKDTEKAETKAQLEPVIETIEATASGLDLLSELMGTLKVDDATVRTRIIDAISSVYAKLNQTKAGARNKYKNLGSEEAVAQFSAQFKLFSQSITNSLGLATTPEKCDEQLSRLLVQLEEFESQFSDFDQFLTDIMDKREEVYESFEAHKQQLLDERQRKAQSVADAADRILSSIEKRAFKFTEADDLNTYLASDALVLKIRELIQGLRELDSAVKADDIESRLKGIRDQAQRALRDKSDIFEDGGNIIKLGPRHRFSVNNQELDLTIIPRNDQLNFHLTGTDYFEPIEDGKLQAMGEFWQMSVESESSTVYRAEYLAMQILVAADNNTDGLNQDTLTSALLDDDQLAAIVRDFAAPRYKEGYEKGIHDHDAYLLLKQLLPTLATAELLKFDPASRALAQIFWANLKNQSAASSSSKSSPADVSSKDIATWPVRAQSAATMQSVLGSNHAFDLLNSEASKAIAAFTAEHPITNNPVIITRAAEYLILELARDKPEFITSKYAVSLVDELKRSMDDKTWRQYQAALADLTGWPADRWQLSEAWLGALVEQKQLPQLQAYVPEAIAIINAEQRLERRTSQVDLAITIDGLLGNHATIEQGKLQFALDEFLQRLEHHRQVVVPSYHDYLNTRQTVINDRRAALRLEEFKPRPLSSFVRNRLINESYLPIIGDNLAKQMGTVGENKRTDLMGLLMMISPPGYGKTTLMEYVANRLGLIFMKINCPSLGHDVMSLDPAQAPNATARQELYKLNLALEMGNNVMLYLDDIQHTHSEFLQKFISLCDGTRRIDGVWKGNTKTYDMRGKKFCVVMAGNPYTETGEAFKVPDMLANRADIYNLGDILGGMEEQFALSYIENSLTSNPVLAPLATREMADVYKLVDMAKGREVASTDLSHQYSAAEINEITDVLTKMFAIQDVVLKINQQYIASAAQDDNYRTEPSFKLQGSYRNMNKMAEKISAVMNEQELMQLITDHYLGEAQLLTTGAEANLLKLAQLRGNITAEQEQRWQEIIADFKRNKAMGGSDADNGAKVVAQLVDMVDGLDKLTAVASTAVSHQQQAAQLITDKPKSTTAADLEPLITALSKNLAQIKPAVSVVNEPVPGLDKILRVLADTIENTIAPLVRTMDKKLEIDLRTHNKMQDISEQLRILENDMKGGN